MKTMKVLILGGEAVGVVDGGCELVEVPVVGCKGSASGDPFEGCVSVKDVSGSGVVGRVPAFGDVYRRVSTGELVVLDGGNFGDVVVRRPGEYEFLGNAAVVGDRDPVTGISADAVDETARIGGVSVTVDYKAAVKAYVDSVPEGGLLIPGWTKVIEEDTVIRAFDNGDYGMTLYFDDGRDNHGEDWYAVYTFLRLDLDPRYRFGDHLPDVREMIGGGSPEGASSPDRFEFTCDGKSFRADTFEAAFLNLRAKPASYWRANYGVGDPSGLIDIVGGTHELSYTNGSYEIRGRHLPYSFFSQYGMAGVSKVKIVRKR